MFDTFNSDDTPGAVPLERVDAEICELAGHLAAATCRFLVLLGDFDARRGWASWEMTSCAAWLSWKCQMSSRTAREQVRVARALRPGGTAVPASPPLPQPHGTIGDCHDADIDPETIIPPWYGERLDLDYAIGVCFANARAEQDRQTRSHDRDREPEARDRVTVYAAEDWDNRIRRYYDEHPREVYRVIQPIPV